MRGSAISAILRKEWGELFFSPIAYIVMAIYLIISGVFFFFIIPFFAYGQATMRNFFVFSPYLLSFAIAGLSMRLYSEELRSGTLEVLNTLPYTPLEILLGKYLAVLLFVMVMQLLTLSYPLTISLVGKLDGGEIISGYLGLLLLTMGYSAIGVFASTLTSNPITAFFITFAITLLLAMLSLTLYFVPQLLVGVLTALSSANHVLNLASGVIDMRDVLYFFSLTFIFLLAAWQMATKER